MADDVTVSFAGPFSWPGTPDAPSIFEVDERRAAGIYLWTVPHGGGHLVYYVGETGRSFAERLHEHYVGHAAGMYHVYAPAEFLQGEKIVLWPGRYDASNRRSTQECIANYPKLTREIHELTYIFRFMVAPLSCDGRVRRRIEAAIADALYAAPGLAGAFQDQGIHYDRRLPGEAPVRCVTTSSVPLLGLPVELWA